MNKCTFCGSIIALSISALTGCDNAVESATRKKSGHVAAISGQIYTTDMLYHHWIFDRDRFNEFFDAREKSRKKKVGAKSSFLEIERRRQNLRGGIDQMPAYTFSKSNGAEVLLTIAGEKLPKKEKTLKSETRAASGIHFSFVDNKNDRCEVIFIDRDHITFTIYTSGRATVLPLIRTVPRSPPSK